MKSNILTAICCLLAAQTIFASENEASLLKKLTVTVQEAIPLFDHGYYGIVKINDGKLSDVTNEFNDGGNFLGYDYATKGSSAPGCYILVTSSSSSVLANPILKNGMQLVKGQSISDFSYLGGTTWLSQRRQPSQLFSDFYLARDYDKNEKNCLFDANGCDHALSLKCMKSFVKENSTGKDGIIATQNILEMFKQGFITIEELNQAYAPYLKFHLK